MACIAGDLAIVEWLVETAGISSDAMIQMRSRKQEVPCRLACVNGHLDIVKFLILKVIPFFFFLIFVTPTSCQIRYNFKFICCLPKSD